MIRNGRLSDLFGSQVRLRRPISNGLIEVPTGAIVTISDRSLAWAKLIIQSEPCACCKVRVYITKVHHDDVELLQVPV